MAARITDPNFQQELAEARALHAGGSLAAAAAAYDRLAARQPGSVELLHLQGTLAMQTGRLPEALGLLRRAAVAVPANYRYRSNLGLALYEEGQLEPAMEEMEAALALKPDSAEVLTNLGNLHRDLGQFDLARDRLRRAAELAPMEPKSQSNWLLGLLYDDSMRRPEIAAAHKAWGERIQAALGPSVGYYPPRDWSATRRLRIGLVSSDLHEHAVSYFLEPLLQAFDREAFELFAYSATFQPDGYTARLRALCADWRVIYGVADELVARQIAEDGIDVLIDLNGHTAGNRLLVFAQRPAPVQISYLGYPHHSGLPAIDFRISDPWADPPDADVPGDGVWRLPRCAWCFSSPMELRGRVTPAGAERSGSGVTFGSFNQLSKISPKTVELWARVMTAVPNARLVVKARVLRDPRARYDFLERFLARKVDISRIALRPWSENRLDHLQQYREIDIALDTYPYHGTTTTCEALWMGVPVVTRLGETHAARVGGSLLRACGAEEWMASDDDTFVNIAVALAAQPDRLRQLHAELPARVAVSPLMDSAGLARAFEGALREIWRQRCTRQSTPA